MDLCVFVLKNPGTVIISVSLGQPQSDEQDTGRVEPHSRRVCVCVCEKDC